MQHDRPEPAELRGDALAARGVIGGILMGLANLVPGISGGTMLLAVGIYPQFVNGVAEVSTFRFRPRTLLLVGCVVGGALVAIVGFARLMSGLVIDHRWVMYSMFIGLTLGGVPLLWRMLRPIDAVVAMWAFVGLAGMAGLAMLDPGGSAGSGAGEGRGYAMLVVAGIAGGAAMILPGLSGSYLLLVLGQYLTILTAIEAARAGVAAGDWAGVGEALHVFVPVGIGVVVGVVGVSNVVRLLLARYERATLGFLLGLLLGSVLGLWPFRHAVEPEIGQVVRGITVTAENLASFHPKDWPTAWFRPTLLQIAGAVALVAGGFFVSVGVWHLGRTTDAAGDS